MKALPIIPSPQGAAVLHFSYRQLSLKTSHCDNKTHLFNYRGFTEKQLLWSETRILMLWVDDAPFCSSMLHEIETLTSMTYRNPTPQEQGLLGPFLQSLCNFPACSRRAKVSRPLQQLKDLHGRPPPNAWRPKTVRLGGSGRKPVRSSAAAHEHVHWASGGSVMWRIRQSFVSLWSAHFTASKLHGNGCCVVDLYIFGKKTDFNSHPSSQSLFFDFKLQNTTCANASSTRRDLEL